MASDETITASGEVMFFWDAGDEEGLLINIDPDDHHKPDAFNLTGEVRASVVDAIEEGARVEVDYLVEYHEIVDPDGATTLDGHRPKILAVRIVDG
jgi:hypothetical protein